MAFSKQLKECMGNVLDIADVARVAKVSKPTVERWLAGKTAPTHGIIRDSVLMVVSHERKHRESLNDAG